MLDKMDVLAGNYIGDKMVGKMDGKIRGALESQILIGELAIKGLIMVVVMGHQCFTIDQSSQWGRTYNSLRTDVLKTIESSGRGTRGFGCTPRTKQFHAEVSAATSDIEPFRSQSPKRPHNMWKWLCCRGAQR